MKSIFLVIVTLMLSSCQQSTGYEKIVKLHLTDPDSVVFKDVFKAKYGGDVWCGQLNARNRMGGMVGFTKFVVEMPDDKSIKDDEINRVFSKITYESDSTFSGKWQLMCVKSM